MHVSGLSCTAISTVPMAVIPKMVPHPSSNTLLGHAAVVPPNCCTVTAANLLAPQLNMGDVHVCVCVCLQKEVFSSALKGIER